MEPKPGNVQLIGIFMIVSGALNILSSIGWMIVMLVTVVGILCTPIALIPIGIGIGDFVQPLIRINY